ncbi:MAG: GlxA family transcriptional regulator [Alphaproteobacteria bacterium]|nr:GlxA family transcriptional regulator [Alphaproteobacteria bacterium]
MFRVAFLLTPEYSLVNVASAIDTLRVANTLLDRPHYAWILVTDTTREVPSSAGLALACDSTLAELKEFDLLLVCGSFKPHKHLNAQTQRLLRRFARHGRMLGSMEAGVFHLAQSGALDGHTVTAHWANMPVYAKLFPKVRFVRDVFTAADKRVSCAGGLSGLDLMAWLVRRDFGPAFARRVANLLQAPWLREEGEAQSGLMALSGSQVPQPVQEACRLMEQRIDAPQPIAAIARKLRLSRRQLDRLFQRVFDTTAAEVQMHIRVTRARKLLRSTVIGLNGVAEACGFASYANFSRAYKRVFGNTPSRERRGPRGATAPALRLMPLFDLHPDQTQHDPERLL